MIRISKSDRLLGTYQTSSDFYYFKNYFEYLNLTSSLSVETATKE